MRISDWSSDVCSSDLFAKAPHLGKLGQFLGRAPAVRAALHLTDREMHPAKRHQHEQETQREAACPDAGKIEKHTEGDGKDEAPQSSDHPHSPANLADMVRVRSEAHTSALQSLMRISSDAFSL